MRPATARTLRGVKLPSIILVAGLLFAGVRSAHAACESDGIVLFPRPGAVIPINAAFILEGRGAEVERVEALVGKTLHLQSAGGESVPVEVRRGWKSEMARVAVRLQVKGKLAAQDRYTLQLDEVLPGYRNLDRRAAQTPSWFTGPGPDTKKPQWQRAPAVAEGRHAVVDGGLIRELRLSAPMKDESPTWVVVTMRRALGPKQTQTYFAPVDGGMATLGHDGCSGGFVFEDGRAYTARVEGYDVAGNAVTAPKPLQFHAPRPPRKPRP